MSAVLKKEDVSIEQDEGEVEASKLIGFTLSKLEENLTIAKKAKVAAERLKRSCTPPVSLKK